MHTITQISPPLNPESYTVWQLLGDEYSKLRRHTEAIEAYCQVLRINSKNANAWNNLALTNNRSGNRATALEAVQQLRRLDPLAVDKLFDMMVPR